MCAALAVCVHSRQPGTHIASICFGTEGTHVSIILLPNSCTYPLSSRRACWCCGFCSKSMSFAFVIWFYFLLFSFVRVGSGKQIRRRAFLGDHADSEIVQKQNTTATASTTLIDRCLLSYSGFPLSQNAGFAALRASLRCEARHRQKKVLRIRKYTLGKTNG